MNFKLTNLFLLVCSTTLVASCGPKKTEETQAPAPEQKQEAPLMELRPVPPQPLPKHFQNNDKPLTPGQKEELEIDEDNVINPFPG